MKTSVTAGEKVVHGAVTQLKDRCHYRRSFTTEDFDLHVSHSKSHDAV